MSGDLQVCLFLSGPPPIRFCLVAHRILDTLSLNRKLSSLASLGVLHLGRLGSYGGLSSSLRMLPGLL